MKKFCRKTQFARNLPNGDIEYIYGYTLEKDAFPFAIAKVKIGSKIIWRIYNRFSGEPLYKNFRTKKIAEKYFEAFEMVCDVNSIEFMDPTGDVDYTTLTIKTNLFVMRE
jgi:hypothetical protein